MSRWSRGLTACGQAIAAGQRCDTEFGGLWTTRPGCGQASGWRRRRQRRRRQRRRRRQPRWPRAVGPAAPPARPTSRAGSRAPLGEGSTTGRAGRAGRAPSGEGRAATSTSAAAGRRADSATWQCSEAATSRGCNSARRNARNASPRRHCAQGRLDSPAVQRGSSSARRQLSKAATCKATTRAASAPGGRAPSGEGSAATSTSAAAGRRGRLGDPATQQGSKAARQQLCEAVTLQGRQPLQGRQRARRQRAMSALGGCHTQCFDDPGGCLGEVAGSVGQDYSAAFFRAADHCDDPDSWWDRRDE